MNVDINEPSYEMMINVDEYISDEFIRNHYDGVTFSEEDFFNQEKNNMEKEVDYQTV